MAILWFQALRGLTRPVFKVAENAEGFIARARENDDLDHLGSFERDWGEWGEFAVPDSHDGGFSKAEETAAGTLSIWEGIFQPLFDFRFFPKMFSFGQFISFWEVILLFN